MKNGVLPTKTKEWTLLIKWQAVRTVSAKNTWEHAYELLAFEQCQVNCNLFFQQHRSVEIYEHTKLDKLYHEKYNNFKSILHIF